jgi:hypothetical protein
MIKPKIVLLIFVSGKIVLTGAKVREEIYQAFEMIYPVLQGMLAEFSLLVRLLTPFQTSRKSDLVTKVCIGGRSFNPPTAMYQHLHTQLVQVLSITISRTLSKALALGWRIPRTDLTPHHVLR